MPPVHVQVDKIGMLPRAMPPIGGYSAEPATLPIGDVPELSQDHFRKQALERNS